MQKLESEIEETKAANLELQKRNVMLTNEIIQLVKAMDKKLDLLKWDI